MNLKQTFCILFLALIIQVSNAQDGIPVYSDYFADNLYILHPSMAGASNTSQLRLTARKQWFDQANAPNLQTLAVNVRMGEQSGIGAIAFNDKNGFHSQIGAYLTYAHHLIFSRSDVDLNQLSFGMNVGVVQSRLDETNFDLTNFDPVIAGILQSTSYFNIDVGASYNFLDLSMHLTIKNLIFQNRNIYSSDFESNNQRRYLFSGSYTLGGRYNTDWTFEPSFLFQFFERTNETAIDINFKTYRKMDFGRLWGGLSYRRSFDGAEFQFGSTVSSQKLQLVTPVIGINFNKFLFAYTYSQQIGKIKFSNGSYHQITLGYNFMDRGKAYDCKCPAIN